MKVFLDRRVGNGPITRSSAYADDEIGATGNDNIMMNDSKFLTFSFGIIHVTGKHWNIY